MLVDYEVRGDIALIGINNPPVNALGRAVSSALEKFVRQAEQDDSVRAMVIYGKGRCFAGGADIREFRRFQTGEKGFQERLLHDNVLKLESKCKPFVAAIHGFAFGGGMEVALSTHYRIAKPDTRFAFPEVTLGILPSWQGTQKFPRVIGFKAALEYISTGKVFTAKTGNQLGFIDEIVTGDILEEGIRYARSICNQPFSHRILSEASVPPVDDPQKIVDDARRFAHQKFRGQMSPILCIKSVEGSLYLPYDKGVEQERKLQEVLMTSGQTKALQYAFFAQRKAVKWAPADGSIKVPKPQSIKTGAVIGAGTMGTGIAMVMLNAGIPVVLVEQNEEFLKKGVDILKKLYMGSVALGRLDEKTAKKIFSQLKPSTSYNDLRDVDIVIEAVYENMGVKKDIFRKLDQTCKPSALLCTNTSGLSIDEIAAVTGRPEKVMGTHFFVPAYYMQLLENVRGAKTSTSTISTVTALSLKVGKVPVLVGNCDGFVGNRVMAPLRIEAVFLVEEGALPHEVDQVLEDWGMPIGTFKVIDLSGLDIGGRRHEELYASKVGKLDEKVMEIDGRRYCPLNDMLYQQGRLGRKTGAGYYRYEKAGGKVAMVDQNLTQFIEEFRQKRGVQKRTISRQEILERCLYSLINESFKVMEEGIANKPEDIDTICLLGFGWPRYTGGPMFHADRVGLKTIYDRVCHYHECYPNVEHWKPSELLKKLAAANSPLSEWSSVGSSKL